jgi:hypothetical protein
MFCFSVSFFFASFLENLGYKHQNKSSVAWAAIGGGGTWIFRRRKQPFPVPTLLYGYVRLRKGGFGW